MRPTRSSLLALIGFLSVVVAPATAGDSADSKLLPEVAARRLTQAVSVFSGLPKPGPDDHYLAGFALMELHRPEEAEPRLRAAKDAGFSAWKGWPGVDALLDRVATVRELLPPSRSASDTITVHTGAPTAWSTPVLHAIPKFEEVGRSIFGKDLPRLRFALFADRKVYDRFFGALFGVSAATAWQDGTGTTNVVVYCATDRHGNVTRAAGDPETIGCVLHEFGHAWFGTYLMDRHGREWLAPAMRRPWLDEGLADFVASLREPAFLDRRAEWLRDKSANKVARPEFAEIADYAAFYEKGDPDVHYWMSALLVAELLGPRDRAPATIRRILDAAGASGDVDEAVRTVTGKDPRKVFAEVIRRFW
jgi:hypothetical protein